MVEGVLPSRLQFNLKIDIMKKLIIIFVLAFMSISLIGVSQSYTYWTELTVLGVPNAQVKTDVFKLSFYDNILLRDTTTMISKIGFGFKSEFTFIAESYAEQRRMQYIFTVGADCIARIKINDVVFVGSCWIKSVENNDIVFTVKTDGLYLKNEQLANKGKNKKDPAQEALDRIERQIQAEIQRRINKSRNN